MSSPRRARSWIWERSGLPGYTDPKGEYHRGKTLWDWAELLVVPLVLLAVAGLFASESARNAEVAAEERSREEALQTYLDRMEELMLEGRLLQSSVDSDIRQVARARTLTTMRRLDGVRNGLIVRFLSESNLLSATAGALPIADFDGIDLSNASLTNSVAISRDILRIIAARPMADLESLHLNGLSLVGSSMRGADLSGADLFGADLTQASLLGADLSNSYLMGANLMHANLYGADLTGADLTHADLSNANLSDAVGVTRADLETTKSYRGAIGLDWQDSRPTPTPWPTLGVE